MVFSALLPRRHRSLIYKVLICIPVLWITIALIMYSERGGGTGASGPSGPSGEGDINSGVRSRGGRRDLSENVRGSGSGSGGRGGAARLVPGGDVFAGDIGEDEEAVVQQEAPKPPRPMKKATAAK